MRHQPLASITPVRISLPRGDAGALTTERLGTPEEIAAVGDAWRCLARDCGEATCFAMPVYFRAWRDTLSGDVEPFLLTAWAGERLAGIMPMMRATVRRGPSCAPRHDFAPSDRGLLNSRRPRPFRLRQLSPVVSMPAVCVGPAPLCRPRERAAVIRAFARTLKQMAGWDGLVLPVDAETEQEEWRAALRAEGLAPWVLTLDRRIGGIDGVAPFQQIVARQNRNFRRNVRRAEGAARDLGLEIVLHQGRDAVLSALPVLAAVAARSWKETGREDADLLIPYSGRQRAFVEALIADPGLEAEMTPVLALARLQGRPVAALLWLLHGDRVTALLTFRTAEAARASPGLLLVGRMIDWAAARNLSAVDLNVTQDWARHLTDRIRTQNNVVCFSNGLRGRALGIVSGLARRLK
ncbi:GNAT family N-acetyltransferase [Acidimangrovimonas pyrenivorans]|uniref:GNAT family N-acetyltransferase n=1 Tax=Acidimangrovimonas pyrenivorans TaxID=2030798 RepID=A0ABV7AH20_9RHOB